MRRPAKIRILEDAEADLLAGFHFYEAQGVGLGDYFLDSLFADIDSLQLYAGVHPVRFGHHRMLAGRFPYAVYYELAGGTASIHAVLDCRRDPKTIRRRLSPTPSRRSRAR